MTYNPLAYWENRGTFYHTELSQEDPGDLMLLEYIMKQVLHSGDKVLEVGCGCGRVYSYLKQSGLVNDSNFSMCDIADSFLDECECHTGIRPDKWDGNTLPYGDGEFALVVSFSVLMHVNGNLLNFLREHMRVSRKHLFVSTWYVPFYSGLPAEHCFLHDYYSYFNLLGLSVSQEVDSGFLEGESTRKNWLLEKDIYANQ